MTEQLIPRGEEAMEPEIAIPAPDLGAAMREETYKALMKFSKPALCHYLASSGLPVFWSSLRSFERCERLRLAGDRVRSLDSARWALLKEFEACKSAAQAKRLLNRANRLGRQIVAANLTYERRLAAIGKDTK